jgi:hypothetical protein
MQGTEVFWSSTPGGIPSGTVPLREVFEKQKMLSFLVFELVSSAFGWLFCRSCRGQLLALRESRLAAAPCKRPTAAPAQSREKKRRESEVNCASANLPVG